MASDREVFKHLADKVTLLGMSRSELIAEVERLQAENDSLKTRLHDQSISTMEAASRISAEVNDAIRRSDGFPEDYTPEGHPAAQNVAMVMARLQAENATLREDAERQIEALRYVRNFGLHGDIEFTDNPEHQGMSVSSFVEAAIDAARKANP